MQYKDNSPVVDDSQGSTVKKGDVVVGGVVKKDGVVEASDLPPVGTVRRNPNGRAVKLVAADNLVSTATDKGAHPERMVLMSHTFSPGTKIFIPSSTYFFP